jgi:hypothetical protein
VSSNAEKWQRTPLVGYGGHGRQDLNLKRPFKIKKEKNYLDLAWVGMI